jgi:ESF2/ABP1 family protein
MSAKVKADDIFNLEEVDSDNSGYDSEEQQSTKKASAKKLTKAATKTKNTAVFGLDQAVNSDEDDDYSSQDEDDEEEDGQEDTTTTASMDSRFKLADDNDGVEDDASKRVRGAKKTKKVKPLTPEELEKFQAARDKTGIVYLSKIPPFMKPVKLRHLLGAFGELGRVYLAPEGMLSCQDRYELKLLWKSNADLTLLLV